MKRFQNSVIILLSIGLTQSPYVDVVELINQRDVDGR